MKTKKYIRNVVDCEHNGDIAHTIMEIQNAGGTVIERYWDGEDCGEAYVVFLLPQGCTPEEFMKRIGASIYECKW